MLQEGLTRLKTTQLAAVVSGPYGEVVSLALAISQNDYADLTASIARLYDGRAANWRALDAGSPHVTWREWRRPCSLGVPDWLRRSSGPSPARWPSHWIGPRWRCGYGTGRPCSYSTTSRSNLRLRGEATYSTLSSGARSAFSSCGTASISSNCTSAQSTMHPLVQGISSPISPSSEVE